MQAAHPDTKNVNEQAAFTVKTDVTSKINNQRLPSGRRILILEMIDQI